MNISAEPHVIGQVPADVVGIRVDDDLVRVPKPAVAEGNVSRGNVPVPAVKPEAPRTAASKMPYMAAAEAARELTMGPGLFDMIPRIAGAGVVADPGLPIHMG